MIIEDLPVLTQPPDVDMELTADTAKSILGEAEQLNEFFSDYEHVLGFVEARVGTALEGLEFERSEEVDNAVHGYYKDHYLLAAAITALCEGDYDSDLFDLVRTDIDFLDWELELSHNAGLKLKDGLMQAAANQRTAVLEIAELARILRDDPSEYNRLVSFGLCGMYASQLFSEPSVGCTTITDQEVQTVNDVYSKLEDATNAMSIKASNYPAFRTITGPEANKARLDASIKTFWRDTRHAGQLLFHGSTHVSDIYKTMGIASRNEQLRSSGVMNAQTMLYAGGDTMHSVVPHWAEQYDGISYASASDGGVFAVPLAEVIRVAPYARDAQYSTVTMKTDREIPVPTMRMPIANTGAGCPDRIGDIGKDRVFFSSPNERVSLPDTYRVRIVNKDCRPPTIIYDTSMTTQSAVAATIEGFGMPEVIYIHRDGTRMTVGGLIDAERTKLIQDMQRSYIESYSDMGVVIPLRVGVFAQAFENMPDDTVRGRPPARIYNRYTPGSEIAT